jgi:hypothetical protein
MKFLQHGDSVVSLRFKFQEVMGQREDAAENEPRSEADVLDEIRGIADFIEQEGGYDDAASIGLLLMELRTDHPNAVISAADQARIDAITVYAIVDDVENNIQEQARLEEASSLQRDVEQHREKTGAMAEVRNAIRELDEMVLASESGDSIRATEIGVKTDAERIPVQNTTQIAVAAPVGNLRQTLKKETTQTAAALGMTEETLLANMEAMAAAEAMNA